MDCSTSRFHTCGSTSGSTPPRCTNRTFPDSVRAAPRGECARSGLEEQPGRLNGDWPDCQAGPPRFVGRIHPLRFIVGAAVRQRDYTAKGSEKVDIVVMLVTKLATTGADAVPRAQCYVQPARCGHTTSRRTHAPSDALALRLGELRDRPAICRRRRLHNPLTHSSRAEACPGG